MIVSTIPIWIVDVAGSILMIVFSMMCLRMAFRLKSRDPQVVIWTYLLWVCLGLTGFAVSRSAGHILKQVLIFSGHDTVWAGIRPWSGAINTTMFVIVSAVTLFFERIWKIYQQISKDKRALETAHGELVFLNQNLERLVAERTKAVVTSEQKYRRIFETSRDMILVASQSGDILELNPAGCQMLGVSDLEVAGRKYRMESLFAYKEDWLNLKTAIDREGFILNAEVDVQRVDGSTRSVLLSGSLENGTGERTVHLLVKDIEERKLMENQIVQADKLASIGQLSAGIAHEINNPLGIILGYTQLLLREEKLQPQSYKDLRTIEKNVKSCKAIVEGLLNFARTSRPEREMIDIHDSLDDVLNFFKQHAEAGGIEITKDYDATIPKMLLDEKKIKQVLINLLMNAKHAVGKKGRISLITRFDAADQTVSIDVTDTGYGIDKKNLSRIFDPFFTTKPTGEGTGLGLSVSYGIVKNHGGDIFVRSRPGKGSTFTVRLPIVSRQNQGE